jgi:ADP-heptose:LPS heptosyltransferase
VLLSTPVLENLRACYPEARIDVLTEKFASDVVAENPFINGVIAFDRKKDSSLSLIRRVRSAGYSLVIDLFCNPRTALVTYLSGAPVRVGFPFRNRAYAYTLKVVPRGGEVHNVHFNLDALRALSVPILTDKPIFRLSAPAQAFADEWARSLPAAGSLVIGVNAGGGWSSKRWGVRQFAAYADMAVERRGAAIAVFWGPGEEQDADELRAAMKHDSIKVPKTSLMQSAACIRRCSYFVSNDSGPMHIAAALGVPTLGIFGPTHPNLQGPYGEANMWIRNEAVPCLGCNLTECTIGNMCMSELTPDTVYRAFEELASRNPV